MSNKKPVICFFGTYDKTYTSNKLVLLGLAKNNVKVIEVNAHIPVTRLDTKDEMTFGQILKRIVNKYRIIPVTIQNLSNIKKCDVIYVGYPGHFDVFFAFIVAKLLGKKLVFNPLLIIYTGFSEEQSILSKNSLLGRGIKFAESLAYRVCDIVFADTPFQKEYLHKYLNVPNEKMRILAIGADDTYYKYTPYTNTKKTLNVVYYGLYSPIHGVEYIIDAAEMLKDDTDIHFTMVGNGNTFQKNYDRAQKVGLKNITFFDNTPLDEHPAIIEKGDIFLGFLQKHPSVERIIPNKVYQGLALNKVVLTADAPVTRATFSHKENMYLVKPASTTALVDALVELKNNPKLRKSIAEAGNELFMKNYTPKAVGQQMVQHIQQIL